jgi:hypothetical protein
VILTTIDKCSLDGAEIMLTGFDITQKSLKKMLMNILLYSLLDYSIHHGFYWIILKLA